jgi:hypothetical protein
MKEENKKEIKKIKGNSVKLITFSKEQDEMIKKIKEKCGHLSDAETVRYAIKIAHDKEFKEYIEAQKARTSRSKMTPEEAANYELTKRNEKIKQREKRLVALCESMGGYVKNGTCFYPIYDKITDIRVGMTEFGKALPNMDEANPPQQYFHGTKEEIVAIIKKHGVEKD